ncbi:hypothetical protein [Moorena sp. SIO3H5]|uniref:hypothetical protein n=1 Tax=Moorena sp. SIO3H5 TaxID=2607834 RepID=UPI0013B98F1B|nr:hypothetical protein [Moorena sp. SIO3H5]NEO73748.1 hypothetical protein [Moorena sp. SIO3H5]
MELENQFLSALKQLLDTEPELFKDSERTELEALIASFPNDTKQLADAINLWCASHSDINNALMALIASKPIREMGPGGTFPTPETKAEDEKNLRETLINQIRKSSPPETERLNTSKGLGPGGTFPTPETKTEDDKNQGETLAPEARNSSTEESKKPNTSKG